MGLKMVLVQRFPNQLEVSVTNRVINRMINKKPTEADLPLSGPKAA